MNAVEIRKNVPALTEGKNVPALAEPRDTPALTEGKNVPVLAEPRDTPALSEERCAEKKPSLKNETNGLKAFELLRTLGSVSKL